MPRGKMCDIFFHEGDPPTFSPKVTSARHPCKIRAHVLSGLAKTTPLKIFVALRIDRATGARSFFGKYLKSFFPKTELTPDQQPHIGFGGIYGGIYVFPHLLFLIIYSIYAIRWMHRCSAKVIRKVVSTFSSTLVL